MHEATLDAVRPAGPVPPNGRNAGWYHTMAPAWATYYYGFPENPADDDRHTPADGSEFRFDKHSDWWELHSYAPDDHDRDLLIRRDPERRAAGLGARAKILAEVAQTSIAGISMLAVSAPAIEIAQRAADIINGLAFDVRTENLRRHLVNAASLLVSAVERVDGGR